MSATVAQIFVPGFSIGGQWVPGPRCGGGEPYEAWSRLRDMEAQGRVEVIRLYCGDPEHRWDAIRVYLGIADNRHKREGGES
jgi:hypothetical protein